MEEAFGSESTAASGAGGGEVCERNGSAHRWKKKHGTYECPEIVIPLSVEERLCWPWKQGLIVKLLRRKISFKALENRLNKLWVKNNTMNIIDLDCDFFWSISLARWTTKKPQQMVLGSYMITILQYMNGDQIFGLRKKRSIASVYGFVFLNFPLNIMILISCFSWGIG